jgi:hypothetical protein
MLGSGGGIDGGRCAYRIDVKRIREGNDGLGQACNERSTAVAEGLHGGSLTLRRTNSSHGGRHNQRSL